MTLRQYIMLMGLGTFLSFFGLLTILFMINPQEAGFLVFIVFYALLFFFLLGNATLLGLIVRFTTFQKEHAAPVKVETSFRQGVLFATIITATLFLVSRELLTWWNTLLLVGAATTVETAFLGLGRR